MTPDPLQAAWQGQPPPGHLLLNVDLLLKEVRRNDRALATTIFWRDVREVGTCVVLIPVWIVLGIGGSLPWSWYLTIPALVWCAAFLLIDRVRTRRQAPQPADSLRQCIEASLIQVEHQAWLLRNVVWWYLLPFAAAILAFVGHVTWQIRAGGIAALLIGVAMAAGMFVVYAGIYRLNQHAVRTELEPRRDELRALLASISTDPVGGSEKV